jgi:hypothetical protein
MRIRSEKFNLPKLCRIWAQTCPATLEEAMAIEKSETWTYQPSDDDLFTLERIIESMRTAPSTRKYGEKYWVLFLRVWGYRPFTHTVLMFTWLQSRRPDLVQSILSEACSRRNQCAIAFHIVYRATWVFERQIPDIQDRQACFDLFGSGRILGIKLPVKRAA